MAIYVYCCNARISFHNMYSKGSSTRALFVNFPSVICLPSMLYLYGVLCSSYLLSWGSQQCNPYQLHAQEATRFSGAVAHIIYLSAQEVPMKMFRRSRPWS